MLSSRGDFFLEMQVDVQNTAVLSADGSSIRLGEYSGEVILVVNVASYCGNTAQYEDLQNLLVMKNKFYKHERFNFF